MASNTACSMFEQSFNATRAIAIGNYPYLALQSFSLDLVGLTECIPGTAQTLFSIHYYSELS